MCTAGCSIQATHRLIQRSQVLTQRCRQTHRQAGSMLRNCACMQIYDTLTREWSDGPHAPVAGDHMSLIAHQGTHTHTHTYAHMHATGTSLRAHPTQPPMHGEGEARASAPHAPCCLVLMHAQDCFGSSLVSMHGTATTYQDAWRTGD